jgi:endoglucanase
VTAATGDRDRFGAVWDWTRENLQRDDGLFAWRWADGEITDDSPATDADIDIAAALATAGSRFGRPGLIDEARRIAASVLDHETAEAGGRLVLVAGPWAREQRIVNPSYLATCGVADLAAVTGDPRWERVAADGVALMRELAAHGLPPDWAVLGGDGRLQPIAGPDEPSGQGLYGPDAARIPARLPACPGGREVAAGLWDRIAPLDADGAALAYALDGRRMADDRHPVGLVGAAGAAQAAGDTTAAHRLFAQARELDVEHPTYYGAAWLALGEVLLGMDRGPDGDAEAPAQARARPVMWARAPAQPEPTTTVPPTTEPPTTEAPATTSPATATTTPTEPATTAPDSPSTTTPAAGGSPPTTTGGTTSGTTSTTADGGEATSSTDDPGVGAGDLSNPSEPGAELRARPAEDRSDPREPARRRTGAIALFGLTATSALGAVLGLRERSLHLNGRSNVPA